MPIRQKLPKSTLVAITTDSAAGSSHRDLLMKYPDVSDRTLRVLRMNGVNVEEWRSEVARGLRDAVEETIAAYRTALAAGKIPPNNLSLSAAILIDKADKLDARHVAGAGPTSLNRETPFPLPQWRRRQRRCGNSFPAVRLLQMGQSQ